MKLQGRRHDSDILVLTIWLNPSYYTLDQTVVSLYKRTDVATTVAEL